MKEKPFEFIVFVSLIFLFLGCSEKMDDNKCRIKLGNSNSKNMGLEICAYDPLSFKEIKFEVDVLDSIKRSFQINISEPKLLNLKLNDQYIQLYLEPGFDMKVESVNTLNDYPVFSGYGSDINNQLAKLHKLSKLHSSPDYFTLSTADFIKRIDSLESGAELIYSKTKEPHISKIITKLFEVSIITKKLNYVLMNYDLYNSDTQIPAIFKKAFHQVLDYPDLLKIGSFDYLLSLHMYFDAVIHPKLWNAKFNKDDSTKNVYSLTVNDNLSEMEIHFKLKEFLLAKNLYTYFQANGVNPSNKKIYDQFSTEYSNSQYLPRLNEEYQNQLGLTKGSLMPIIEGITPTEELISLNDLKGKVIYLDIWATWCKPCVEEFAYSQELLKNYSNDNIEFVYISVDSDKETWLNFITENNDIPEGLHLLEAKEGSIFNSLRINGIPRYILIDKQGRVIDIHAPKPSSNKIKELIDSYIKE